MTRLPSIDGLRGIAALLVIVFHSFPLAFEWGAWWQLNPGILGVRLFFVLSGCLISGLLWTMQDERRTFGQTWRRFAFRRALRIFPLAYLAMGVAWLAGVPAMWEQPWYHLTFTNNFAASDPSWPDGLSHFWTLAVEEQIYALWPLLVLLIPAARWPVASLALMAGAVFSRIVLQPAVWYSPIYCVDAFAAGSLVAWSARQGRLEDALTPLAAIGVCLLSVSWLLSDAITFSVFELGLVLMTASIVGWAWANPTVLSWRPLVWVGTISYGVYVWHQAAPDMIDALGWHAPTVQGWDVLALKTGLGIGLAALTWYGVERPINRLKDRVSRSARSAVDHHLDHSIAGVAGLSGYENTVKARTVSVAIDRPCDVNEQPFGSRVS